MAVTSRLPLSPTPSGGDKIARLGVLADSVAAVSKGMPTVDTKRVREEDGEVLAWRAEELVRAGYDGDNALMLALERAVDLHRAVDLLRRGCPAELAVKILL